MSACTYNTVFLILFGILSLEYSKTSINSFHTKVFLSKDDQMPYLHQHGYYLHKN